jgi:hypothetical protein
MQNPGMSSRSRLFLLVLGWLALTAAGCVVVVLQSLNAARAQFLAEAGVMHRLLSQQIRQHEALLDTLVVLQPAPPRAGALAPEQRLTAVHPAVHSVLRQDDVSAWPEELAPALDAALLRSTASGRVVAADLGATGAAGATGTNAGIWLVLGAKPASFALQFDLTRLAKEALESPFAGQSSVAAWLEQTGQPKLMLAGQAVPGGPSPWRHDFRQILSARSLSVDLVATRQHDPLSLPWVALAAWCLATSFLGLGLAAWLQARGARKGDRAQSRLFGREADEAFDQRDVQRKAYSRRSYASPEGPGWQGRGSPSLSVTLRELDVEPPELTVARGAINQAARESRRSAEMIANLRRSAQQPLLEERLQPLLWDELLRDAFEVIESQCARLGIATTLITDDEAAFVLADPVALEQVINRLLDQAVQALSGVADERRQLDVTLAAQPDAAVLSVHDTGVTTDSRAQEIKRCEQMLADMGGRITVEEIPPRGAVVRVALPRVTG